MKNNDLFSTLGVKVIHRAFDEAFCDLILQELFDCYSRNETELKEIELRKTYKHKLSRSLEEVVLKRVREEIQPELESFFGTKLSYSKPIQTLLYNKGHFFKPHKDDIAANSEFSRKITTVFFLNRQGTDPLTSEYEGGTLSLYGLLDQFPNNNFAMPCSKGTMVAFRADTIHEVTEITRGQRCSLVVWFN